VANSSKSSRDDTAELIQEARVQLEPLIEDSRLGEVEIAKRIGRATNRLQKAIRIL
jgi:hypothetical protein